MIEFIPIRQIVAIYMILYIISQRLRTDGEISILDTVGSLNSMRADSLLYMGKGDIGVGLGLSDRGLWNVFPV